MIKRLPLKLFASATALLIFVNNNAQAQTLKFTSTPATSAVEKVSYSTSIAATIDNNEELTFSAPTLPSWLTLSSSGSGSAIKVSETTFQSPSGVAGDADGNFYVIENGHYLYENNNTPIYKIRPDGTSTVWATMNFNNEEHHYYYSWCYSMIVVEDYLYAAFYNGYSPGIYKFKLTSENPTPELVYNGNGILGITYHDGYIYTAEYGNSRVGRVKLSDGTYSSYISEVPSAFGLGFLNDGSMLIACYGDNKIRKYADGVLSVVVSETDVYPSDVKSDASGNLYVSSLQGGGIRKYAPDFSSYTVINNVEEDYIYSISTTPNGTLVYGSPNTGFAYALQTGASLTGTPGHEHVGVHPVKVTVTNGTVSKDLEFSITVTDPNPPTVEIYRPAHESVEIALDSTLQLVFSETIEKGEGKIFIKAKFDNSVLKSFDVADEKVMVKDSLLTVKLGGKLPYLTDVYVEIEPGAIKDVNDNSFQGISDPAKWAYTTIEQRQVEQAITFATSNTVDYGVEDFKPKATTDSELKIVYTSSDESIAEIVEGKVRVKKPGVVTITAKQEGNEDFFAAKPVEQTLTIDRKKIEVSLLEAPSVSKVYDGKKTAAISSENYQLTGIVKGDDVNVNGLAEFDNADAGTDKVVSVHSFSLSGEDKDKYKLITEQSTLPGTIVPKKIKVYATDQTKVYGSGDPEFSYQVEGLLNDDGLQGTLSREVGKNVGEYEINPGTLTAGKNYEILYTKAKLAITPANLLIKAEDQSREQGKSNASFKFSFEGLVAGDMPSALTSQPHAQTSADKKSPIGYYDITVNGAASPNYAISYAKGRLSVVPGEASRIKAWSSSPAVLHVRVYADVAQKAALVLFTDAGQSIVLQRHQLNAGVNDFTMNVGNVTSNIYILHVNADKFKESQRVKIK